MVSRETMRRMDFNVSRETTLKQFLMFHAKNAKNDFHVSRETVHLAGVRSKGLRSCFT